MWTAWPHWVRFEFVEGGDLYEFMANHPEGIRDEALVRRFVRQLLKALAFCHDEQAGARSECSEAEVGGWSGVRRMCTAALQRCAAVRILGSQDNHSVPNVYDRPPDPSTRRNLQPTFGIEVSLH